MRNSDPNHQLTERKTDFGMHVEAQKLQVASSTTCLRLANPEVPFSSQCGNNYDDNHINEAVGNEMPVEDYAVPCQRSRFERDTPLSGHGRINVTFESPIVESVGRTAKDGTPKLDEPGIFSTHPPPSMEPTLYSDDDMEYDRADHEAALQNSMSASIIAAMLNHHYQGKPESNANHRTSKHTMVAMEEKQSLDEELYEEEPKQVGGALPRSVTFFEEESNRLNPTTRGVCDYPSLNLPSFMMVGDTGATCWVTASGLEKVTRHGVNRKRWHFELPDHVEVDAHGSPCTHVGGKGELFPDEASTATTDDDDETILHEITSFRQKPSLSLLGSPTCLKELLREVNESEARSGAREEAMTTDVETLLGVEPYGQSHSTSHATRRGANYGELWVMKYAPRHFREVLSDETINLRLLRWLKSWDSYVFQGDTDAGDAESAVVVADSSGAEHAAMSSFSGSNPPSGAKTSSGVQKIRRGPDKERAAADGNNETRGPARDPESKPMPPIDRMALLVGPPGIGKTTLAHILAAHCGYEAVEVNASMERTYAQLEALIRMTVSSSGVASSRVPRRKWARPVEDGHGAGSVDTPAFGSPPLFHSKSHSASLVDQLLKPKCLIIDEMDGMATSVAQLLLNLDIRRPVFCLCNDFYVASLRPLRKRCQNVFFVPPISPQRLLSRLSEIAAKEDLTIDQAVLSEIVKTSNGDVRSCLNTLQLIKCMPIPATAPTTAGSESVQTPCPTPVLTLEMIRQIQGKDSQVDVWEGWKYSLSKMDRIRVIQQLKEYGVDYEELMAAATVNRAEGMVACRKRRREGLTDSSAKDHSALTERAGRLTTPGVEPLSPPNHEASLSFSEPLVKAPFRFDPGYLHLACLLRQRAGGLLGGRTFIDGLQDNFLDQQYRDYSLEHTNAVTSAFSTQNVFTTRAFTHNAPSGIDFASKFEVVTALRCYVHCGRQTVRDNRATRLRFPREHAQIQQLLSASLSTLQSFRDGCQSLEVATHLWSTEQTAGDVCPLMLRSLFDHRLRLSTYPMADFSSLPEVDQRYLQAAVERHVVYGLTYRKQSQPHFFFNAGQFGFENRVAAAPQMPNEHYSPHGLGGAEATYPEDAWCLTPSIDHVGGFRRHFVSERWGALSSNAMLAQRPSTTSNVAEARSLSPLFMTMKDEIRQMLVGAIQRHTIVLMAKRPLLSSSSVRSEAHNASSSKAASSNRAIHLVEDIKQAPPPPPVSREHEPLVKSTNDISCIPNKTAPDGGVISPKVAIAGPPVAGVKRDFFGRMVPASTKINTTLKGSAGTKAMTARATPVKPPVRYVYHDGSTNAVKFPATIHDF